jgi:hypothetical protein
MCLSDMLDSHTTVTVWQGGSECLCPLVVVDTDLWWNLQL